MLVEKEQIKVTIQEKEQRPKRDRLADFEGSCIGQLERDAPTASI